jgi:hypothetical protein
MLVPRALTKLSEDSQHLPVKRVGLRVSLRVQRLGQVEHRCQWVRVLLTQEPGPGLEHLLLERADLGQVSLRVQRLGQVEHRCQCDRVLLTQEPGRGLEHLLLKRAGPWPTPTGCNPS